MVCLFFFTLDFTCTYVYLESNVECSIKLLILKGRGSEGAAHRSQSKLADDKALGDLIPQMQALNLHEHKLIRSA